MLHAFTEWIAKSL